jgi:Fe-S cluster assembly protein SufD
VSDRAMTQVTERQEQYLSEYDRLTREVAGQPTWVREARTRAMAHFTELGFPTTRNEEWRFTSVAPIAETAFRLAGPANGAARQLSQASAFSDVWRVVVANGRMDASLSDLNGLPDGLEISGLAEAIAGRGGELEGRLGQIASMQDRAFAALNGAFLHDGVFIAVRRGTIVERPIHLVFVTSADGAPVMAHPRVFVSVGEGAQLRVIETYVGEGARYLTNVVAEYDLGDNAVVDHYKDQREGLGGFHIGLQAVRCARSSTFVSHSFVLGGQIVRNDAIALLAGEGVDCTLNGLYVADGQRLVDNHTTIDHAQPHCGSHELYKGILAGRARAVFNGKIIVRQDAQKTDAKQTNRALLLSDDAQINTKPQLEIFADDVKCTHGAAIGQLDEEALFYLRARGLTSLQARDLLIHAFAGDLLTRVKFAALRDRLETELFAQLQRDGVM